MTAVTAVPVDRVAGRVAPLPQAVAAPAVHPGPRKAATPALAASTVSRKSDELELGFHA
jgi:hypothetical protein